MTSVNRCAIYPPIGIARVGNSPREWFLGPEAPGIVPQHQFKDAEGRVKRQAARFRVYAEMDDGSIRELTTDDARVEWTVHVANTKPAWYESLNAMDLPGLGMTAQRRNKQITIERQQLEINPGPLSIEGPDAPAVPMEGDFMGNTLVELGELRTDGAGRLIVLGGFGYSMTPLASNPITNFSNNDYWHDDVSDGPVTARVWVNGAEIQVEPAWVAVTPPNYAPAITPITTLYELCRDAVGLPMHSDPISFAEDVYPIFNRLSRLQWVSGGQDMYHGWKAQLDFLDMDYVSELADPQPNEAKTELFDALRNPDFAVDEPDKIPAFMGDGIDYPSSPRRWWALLPSQYEMLRQWSLGDFTSDGWREAINRPPRALEEYAIAEQPEALTRGALEPCLGGPFHPGIELTWPMRHGSMYTSPFRLKRRPVSDPLTIDYGPLLSPEECLAEGGPLFGSAPGDLTRWMGCPWQSDAASCQDIYVPSDFPLPAWWPAILPIDVLPEAAYRQVLDVGNPVLQRQKFFGFRRGWSRGVGDVGYHVEGGYSQAMIHMVNDWKQLGFVVEQPGPVDAADADLPSTMYVECEREELEH